MGRVGDAELPLPLPLPPTDGLLPAGRGLCGIPLGVVTATVGLFGVKLALETGDPDPANCDPEPLGEPIARGDATVPGPLGDAVAPRGDAPAPLGAPRGEPRDPPRPLCLMKAGEEKEWEKEHKRGCIQ